MDIYFHPHKIAVVGCSIFKTGHPVPMYLFFCVKLYIYTRGVFGILTFLELLMGYHIII